MFKRFLLQLINPMIIVLLIAAAVNLVTVIIDRSRGGDESFAEFIIIVAVVLLNAILGVVQEGRAEHAIEALKEMTRFHLQGDTRRTASRGEKRRDRRGGYRRAGSGPIPYPQTAVFSSAPPSRRRNPL